MPTQTERDSIAFAELVRKLAIGLVNSANAGNLGEVQQQAGALLIAACERKKELRERMEAEAREENYDLSELRQEFGEDDGGSLNPQKQ